MLCRHGTDLHYSNPVRHPHHHDLPGHLYLISTHLIYITVYIMTIMRHWGSKVRSALRTLPHRRPSARYTSSLALPTPSPTNSLASSSSSSRSRPCRTPPATSSGCARSCSCWSRRMTYRILPYGTAWFWLRWWTLPRAVFWLRPWCWPPLRASLLRNSWARLPSDSHCMSTCNENPCKGTSSTRQSPLYGCSRMWPSHCQTCSRGCRTHRCNQSTAVLTVRSFCLSSHTFLIKWIELQRGHSLHLRTCPDLWLHLLRLN